MIIALYSLMKIYLRKYISVMLALILLIPTTTFAKQSELKDVASRYGRVTGYDLSALKIASKASAKTVEGLGHQGQALLLIMMLSGVDLVKQNLEKSKIDGQRIDPKKISAEIAEAAQQILSSGQIWSSLAGASVAMGISQKPLQILNKLIANSTSHRLLKNLLQSGMATLITFVGWEIGGQLYTEATYLLEDPEDFARSKDLMPILLNSLKQGTFSQSPSNEKDWLLLRKIFSNMMSILVYDHDLRNLWLYNAWRMKIATGEFVTLVSAMVGASALGSTIFPGAGTIAGLMFGLAGGVLSLFIPENIKEGISEKIQSARWGVLKLGSDDGGIFNVSEDVLKIAHGKLKNNEPLPPLLPFPSETVNWELRLNIVFERLFKCESRIDVLSGKMSLAQFAKNEKELAHLRDLMTELENTRHEIAMELAEFYKSKDERLAQLLSKYPVLNFNAPDNHNNFLTDLRKLKDTLPKLTRFFEKISLSILSVNGNSADRPYMEILYRFYFFSYSEEQLLRAIGT
jgi:hypothetical protein